MNRSAIVRTEYHEAGARARSLAASFLFLAVACRSRPPEIHTVVVTATPAPVVAAETIAAPEPTPTSPEQTAAFDVVLALPAEEPAPAPAPPTPTAFHIANRDPTPTPTSLREQMEQCVVLTVEQDYSGGPLTGAAQLLVKAKNLCNVAFAWDDVWVEARSRPLTAEGILGRQVGRLHSELKPLGEAKGFFVVPGASNGPFHRFDAVLWWAAGGGKRPGQ